MWLPLKMTLLMLMLGSPCASSISLIRFSESTSLTSTALPARQCSSLIFRLRAA